MSVLFSLVLCLKFYLLLHLFVYFALKSTQWFLTVLRVLNTLLQAAFFVVWQLCGFFFFLICSTWKEENHNGQRLFLSWDSAPLGLFLYCIIWRPYFEGTAGNYKVCFPHPGNWAENTSQHMSISSCDRHHTCSCVSTCTLRNTHV